VVSAQIMPSPWIIVRVGSSDAWSTPREKTFGFVPCSGARTATRSRATIREISLVGSSRSPVTIARVGHTTTHAGSRPTSTRWLQKLHL
jgi:hypothetical protein